jgi:hypothetical protein
MAPSKTLDVGETREGAMPEIIVPSPMVGLLGAFEPCFHTPSYRIFRLVLAGWIHCLGRRTVTAVALASGGVGQRHISVFHRYRSVSLVPLHRRAVVPRGRLKEFVVRSMPTRGGVAMGLGVDVPSGSALLVVEWLVTAALVSLGWSRLLRSLREPPAPTREGDDH